MPAGVLQGRPNTVRDDDQWILTRYVMIPWNVRRDTLDAPYVLVDGTRTSTPVETPAGFAGIYASANGLAVLKNLSVQ
jgi:hypothetical protein